MVRITDFSAKVLKKLTDHRTKSDINGDHVKKLLHATMTEETNFTAEQMELIKSVMKQCIVDDRKFNEGLSNGTLKSLLSLIDMQNTKLLESHSSMLEMVSLFKKPEFNTVVLMAIQTGETSSLVIIIIYFLLIFHFRLATTIFVVPIYSQNFVLGVQKGPIIMPFNFDVFGKRWLDESPTNIHFPVLSNIIIFCHVYFHPLPIKFVQFDKPYCALFFFLLVCPLSIFFLSIIVDCPLSLTHHENLTLIFQNHQTQIALLYIHIP